MKPEDILNRLGGIIPDFPHEWANGESLYRNEDGSFTACGVFSECSDYVRTYWKRLNSDQFTALDPL
jgi:hypothetical protein